MYSVEAIQTRDLGVPVSASVAVAGLVDVLDSG